MNKPLVRVCLVFALAFVSMPVYAAKDLPPAKQKPIVFDDEALKQMTERGAANEHHEILAQIIGEWDYAASVWPKAGAEPEESTGTITNQIILGGRYLASQYNGILRIDNHFVPFEAQSFVGYDTQKKGYDTVWMDNLGTGMMTGTGTYDEKSKTLSDKGEHSFPISGKRQGYRAELEFTDAETHKKTIYAVDKSGKENKVMEFVFTRKK
jgi:Protein of unknown function (DUF1579)